MRRAALALTALALLAGVFNTCWMPVSLCKTAAPASSSCHHEEQSPAATDCCGGTHAELSQAAVAQAPALETAFFVVAVLSSADLAVPASASWALPDSALAPPPSPPPEPSLGRAPPVLS